MWHLRVLVLANAFRTDRVHRASVQQPHVPDVSSRAYVANGVPTMPYVGSNLPLLASLKALRMLP